MNPRASTLLLLAGAGAWIGAAGAVALVATVLLALGAGLVIPVLNQLGVIDADRFAAPGVLAFALVATGAFLGTLLAAALWMRRGTPDGFGPSGPWRSRLITALCLGLFGWALAISALGIAFPAFADFTRDAVPEMLKGDDRPGPGILVPGLLLITVLAPVAEEFFFRGWLWGALARRGHGVWVCAGLTAGPWLALHALETPARVLFLIPAALALSVARHAAGGLRASLTVHLINNVMAAAMTALALAIPSG